MRRVFQLRSFRFAFLPLFLFSTLLLAQEENGSDQDEASNDAQPIAKINESGERIIYIPFKDLGRSFENPDSNIVLPYTEYKAMLDAWKASQSPNSTPDAVISTAEYTISIDGELARIQVELNVNVLGKPWVELPVRFGDAAVGKVTGDDVLLRGIGNGQYALLFSEAGEKTVTLELAVRVHQSPDGQEFSFEVPPVAVTTLDVTVPKSDQSIEVTPKIVELTPDMEPEGGDDSTRVRANIGATNKIAIKWHPEASLKPEMNLLASVTNNTLVNVEDGLIHTDTYLDYEILRGSMEQCRIVVPGSHRILDVSASARIKSWKTIEQDEDQIVEVEFLSAVEKPVRVEIHTERKLAESGQFEAAGHSDGEAARGIHALDAVRESGQIAVRHTPDFSLTVAEQQGVVRIESSAVNSTLAGENAFTYKFYAPDLNLTFTAKPVEPRLLAGHQILLTFQDDELQLVNTLQYNIERAGIFELKFLVPGDVEIDDVQSPQMKEYNLDEDSGELTVTLLEKTIGAISISIRGHRDLDEQAPQLLLPLIEPLNVERETGQIYVYAKDAIEVITQQDGLEGVQPLPANAARRGNVSLNSAWSFTRRPLTIPVRTVRKPTRLSARVGTSIDVQPELTQVKTQLDYIIEYSGVDTFRFEVPEGISDSIQIELEPGDKSSAPIKQRTSSDPVDGWVTWTVVTQREILGRQRFVVRYDVAETENGEDAESGGDTAEDSAPEVFDLFRPLGIVDDEGNVTTPLTDVQGEVVVEKERSLSITANATGGDVEQIDLRELKFLPQQGTLAFRYYRAEADDRAQVNIVQSRHEIQEVVSTVVSRGLVEVVTGEDSEGTYRCRFLVKTTERQRMLVHLPVGLEVLGTFLNDREVNLEKAEILSSESVGENWTPFWVNVARTESSEQQFLLTFQFLWQVNPPLGASTFGRGEMMLPLPIIGGRDSSVIQELKVAIWVPEKYALVGDPADFHLQTDNRPGDLIIGELADRETDELDNWVSQGLSYPSGVAQFPTEGRVPFVYTNLGGARVIEVQWWNRVKMTLIVSIAIALIGWILLKTSWENKLGMLLVAMFAAALYGLSDSHALSQGIHAARFGILLLLGLWIIHGGFQLVRSLQPTTSNSPALKPSTTTAEESDAAEPSPADDNPATETNEDA